MNNVTRQIASRLISLPIAKVVVELDNLSDEMCESVMQETKRIRAELARRDKVFQMIFLDPNINQDFKNAMLGI